MKQYVHEVTMQVNAYYINLNYLPKCQPAS